MFNYVNLLRTDLTVNKSKKNRLAQKKQIQVN